MNNLIFNLIVNNIETIGWIAGILFACCGIPQSFLSYKEGNSKGISHLMIWMWFIGEILMLVYILIKVGQDGPLMLNYILNILSLLFIIRYKYFPRKEIWKTKREMNYLGLPLN
jgi:uncharacterized protein with PQ loop repeat